MGRLTIDSLHGLAAPDPSGSTGPFARLTPMADRLTMPAQRLDEGARAGSVRLSEPGIARRRATLLTVTGLASVLGASVMWSLLGVGGFTLADAAALIIFTILFSWIAFSFVSALAGFAVSLRAPLLDAAAPQPIVFTRTALLMPTYNEDPARILAGVQAICEDLAGAGVSELYDIFVLSDTREEAIARAEAAGVLRLLRSNPLAQGRVFYRRRPQNIDRKAGNIADWVQTFGGAYESMIILDADSLMSADTIVRLTAAMEADRRVGLIQTLPLIVHAQTLFGRLQQFAGRVYGPMIAQGQDWWSGAEGNYWGHNAIIRTRAFADHAGLPHLKGAKPFGGHILSHDFVEAALLRRGGWAVRMAATLTGSFEETPPSLIDMAARDRRWCQGNLQHAALLRSRGLHWISRLHLFRGVLSYLTAPLWLAFLAVGAVVWIEQRQIDHANAEPAAAGLLALTFLLLLGPKLLAGLLVLRSPAMTRASGGRFRFGLSLMAEMLMSALAAPTLMLMQSRAALDVLSGRDSGWNAQQRDSTGLEAGQAWRAHGWHVLTGAVCALAALGLDSAFFWWTSPVTVGLLLSAALSAASARTDLGEAARRLGLFVTPEEALPPPIAARAMALRKGRRDVFVTPPIVADDGIAAVAPTSPLRRLVT